MAFKIHPLANFFPRMSAGEYELLKADIHEHGQQVPIVKQGDTILDGRHRYDICRELEIKPLIMEWEGSGSPEAFIASMNLHRRHLTESQRGLIAAEMNARRAVVAGGQTIGESEQTPGPTLAEAAAVMKVSERTVQDAKVVLERGTPHEVEAVRQGKARASKVAKDIRSGKTPTQRAADRKRKQKPENKATAAPKTADAPPPPPPAKNSTHEMAIIARVKEAVTALAFMPEDAAMVVDIVRDSDSSQYVEERLFKAFDWLKAFLDEWITARDKAVAARAKAT